MRGAAARAALALALACACWLAPSCGERDAGAPDSAAGAQESLRNDPRLLAWLEGCPPRGPFEADTSALVPLFVRQLQGGWRDALPIARRELARTPSQSVPALASLLESVWSQPFADLVAINVLDAAAEMPAGEGHALLVRGLEHPAVDVRIAAVHGLARHPAQEDFDALLALLERAEPELWAPTLLALERCDGARLRRTLARWIAEGTHEGAWSRVAASLAACEPEAARLLEGHWSEASLAIRPWLAACRARQGDERARAWLAEALADPDANLRAASAQAARAAGELELLRPALQSPDPLLRQIALGAFVEQAPEDEARVVLERALGDATEGVRAYALSELVARGAPAAVDHALEQLGGAPAERERALSALQRRFETEPELAARAFDVLARELEARSGAPVAARAALEAELARVPDPRAARLLLARASATPPGAHERSQTMRDHRWLVLRAGTSSAYGRALLRERWALEEQPLRRLDLIEGSLGDEELDREFLLGLLEGARASAWERLYAADRLARLGPAELVLPLLKRAALACDDPLVRPAFDCLLWSLFGA